MEWIKISERLPEEMKFVLTYSDEDNEDNHEYIEKGFIDKNGNWKCSTWEHESKDYESMYFVTHWMPLPEPPKHE